MRVLVYVASLVLILLRSTWRVSRRGEESLQAAMKEGGVVLAFRHGEMLPLIALYSHLPALVMVSRSRDGGRLAALLSAWGLRLTRGSSSQGGDEAYQECLQALAQGLCPALAVDGPRGPAGVPKPGAARLALASGRPLCWMRARCSRGLRLKSWDGFLIPAPFARITLDLGILQPLSAANEQELTARLQEVLVA